MKTFSVVAITKLTELEVSDILCTALEGGSNYWLTDYRPKTEMKQIDEYDNYVGITLLNPSPDEEIAECCEPALKDTIELEDIANALTKLASDPEGCKVNGAYRFNSEDYDANDADIVLQVAVFGEVIYG